MPRTIHHDESHFGWDNSIPPVLELTPGDSLEFEVMDASGGQLTSRSEARDIERLDFDALNPTVGPIAIVGAQPGDALRVTVNEFRPSGSGWTAIIPGFGLLADEFPAPSIVGWEWDPEVTVAELHGVARVALNPFPGTIGVAPAAPGRHSVIPPRRVGGNLDTKDLTAGAVLWLPIEVDGALFSVGDLHAAQGDGEVCGTAIETAMSVALTFDVVKGAAPPWPRFETTGVRHGGDDSGVFATTGIGPDLMQAAKDATRGMIDLLCRDMSLEPDIAYILCSVCADLRISEIVDRPNWVVSLQMPKSTFRSTRTTSRG